MCATVTITAELTRQGLLEVKEAIDGLLEQRKLSSVPEPECDDVVSRKAQLFHAWAGGRSWDFIHTIAKEYQPNQEFTFEDLSKTFGVGVATVKSWHRSAAKPMKRVDFSLDDGSEVIPKFLGERWDGSRQHYWMSEEMRDAVLEAGGG